MCQILLCQIRRVFLKALTTYVPSKSANFLLNLICLYVDCEQQWRSQHKIFLGEKLGGAKIFDFRRTTVLCWGYRLSKHNMTRYAKVTPMVSSVPGDSSSLC